MHDSSMVVLAKSLYTLLTLLTTLIFRQYWSSKTYFFKRLTYHDERLFSALPLIALELVSIATFELEFDTPPRSGFAILLD